MRIVIGPWRWTSDDTGDLWDQPVGSLTAIDLRPLTACGPVPERSGGVFVLRDSAPDPGLAYTTLGRTVDDRLTALMRLQWEAIFGTSLVTGDTIADAVMETIGRQASLDPDHLRKPGPVMPDRNSRVRARFLGRDLHAGRKWNQARDSRDIEHDALIGAALRQSYAHLRSRDVSLARRWLGFQVRKYGEGFNWRGVQGQHQGDGDWLPPETSFADSFNRGTDSSNLNVNDTGKQKNGSAGTWQWNEVENGAEIDTNQLHGDDLTAYARIEDDLSGGDQECWSTIASFSFSSTPQYGPCVRFSTSANTSYMAMADTQSGGPFFRLRKTVNGSRSNLGSEISHTWSPGEVLKTVIDGTTLSGEVDDVELDSLTDTAIPDSNTRVGFYIHPGNPATIDGMTVDDFFGQDLSSSVVVSPSPEAISLTINQPTITLLHSPASIAALFAVAQPAFGALSPSPETMSLSIVQPTIALTRKPAAETMSLFDAVSTLLITHALSALSMALDDMQPGVTIAHTPASKTISLFNVVPTSVITRSMSPLSMSFSTVIPTTSLAKIITPPVAGMSLSIVPPGGVLVLSPETETLTFTILNDVIPIEEIIEPETIDLEWSAPVNRLHYASEVSRLHYTAPQNRLHYTARGRGSK